MQGHAAQSGQFTQYAFTAVFVVLVLGTLVIFTFDPSMT